MQHYQATGADQVAMLELELARLGMRCWVDNKAEDLTKEVSSMTISSFAVISPAHRV